MALLLSFCHLHVLCHTYLMEPLVPAHSKEQPLLCAVLGLLPWMCWHTGAVVCCCLGRLTRQQQPLAEGLAGANWQPIITLCPPMDFCLCCSPMQSSLRLNSTHKARYVVSKRPGTHHHILFALGPLTTTHSFNAPISLVVLKSSSMP